MIYKYLNIYNYEENLICSNRFSGCDGYVLPEHEQRRQRTSLERKRNWSPNQTTRRADDANARIVILTADLLALQEKAQGVHFWGNFFPGFQWDLAVQDACSENRETKIEGITPVDSLHCDVAMRYVDSTCYDDPYTLKLLKENGEPCVMSTRLAMMILTRWSS